MTIENPRGQLLRAHAMRDLQAPTMTSLIDMARWLAALMVMVGHLRNPLFLGWRDLRPEDQTLAVKLWYFVTGFHAEAVIVFFVLSGYLVGGLAAARGSEGRWNPRGYASDRVSRLFIAFVPAVLLTALLDGIGSTWFGATGLYDGTHPMVIEKLKGLVYQDNATLGILVGNLLMLQHYFVPEFGSNEPLWTLSSEFWFYAVFGLLLTGLLARTTMRRWLALGLALVLFTALGWAFLGYFGLWVVGLAISQLQRPPLSHPLIASAALFGWLAILRFKDSFFDANLDLKLAAQYLLAALFGWLILSMRDRRAVWLERLGPLNKVMAGFSYSVYLIHFPVIWFTLAVLGATTGIAGFATAFRPTDPVGVATYVGMVLFILAAAWLFAQATERHTPKLREALRARFMRS